MIKAHTLEFLCFLGGNCLSSKVKDYHAPAIGPLKFLRLRCRHGNDQTRVTT